MIDLALNLECGHEAWLTHLFCCVKRRHLKARIVLSNVLQEMLRRGVLFQIAMIPEVQEWYGWGSRFTLPPEQHIPGASPSHLSALQCEQTLFICPM